jgi:hypothetical protein
MNTGHDGYILGSARDMPHLVGLGAYWVSIVVGEGGGGDLEFVS